MCSRYSYSSRAVARLARSFELPVPEVEPRFNVPPATSNPVVLLCGPEGPRMELLRWGLVPSWSKTDAGAAKMINARSETVAEKPAYREAYRSRRCLIVADGFYEWEMRGKVKQPWLFQLRDPEAPMVLAGIWERWQPPEAAESLLTYAMLTTAANETVAQIHERMPLILDETAWEGWLDPRAPLEGLHALLRPWPQPLNATAVTRRMNNVRFQGPECQQSDPDPEIWQQELFATPPLNSE